jgi:hypothetical protein
MAQGKESCSIEQLFFACEAGGLFVAAVTFNRALVFCLVASQAEGVAFLHVPVFVRREVGVLVAGIAFIFALMLGMGEYGGLLACIGLQGNLVRWGRSVGRGIQENQHAGEYWREVFHGRWGLWSVRACVVYKMDIKKAARRDSTEQLFCSTKQELLVAIRALGRAAFCLVAILAQAMAFLHVPFLVGREVGVLVARIAILLGLVLGVRENSGLLASFGLQGDVGRALVCGKSGACNGKAENKREGCGTDNGFLHCSSPLIQLVYKIGFMNPHSLTNNVVL